MGYGWLHCGGKIADFRPRNAAPPDRHRRCVRLHVIRRIPTSGYERNAAHMFGIRRAFPSAGSGPRVDMPQYRALRRPMLVSQGASQRIGATDHPPGRRFQELESPFTIADTASLPRAIRQAASGANHNWYLSLHPIPDHTMIIAHSTVRLRWIFSVDPDLCILYLYDKAYDCSF